MAFQTSLLYLFAIVCILMHEAIAQDERPDECTKPMAHLGDEPTCGLLINGSSYQASTDECIEGRYSFCLRTENFFQTIDDCLECLIKPESPTKKLFREIKKSMQECSPDTLDKLSQVEQQCSACKHSEP